jgi:hypothetical protein
VTAASADIASTIQGYLRPDNGSNVRAPYRRRRSLRRNVASASGASFSSPSATPAPLPPPLVAPTDHQISPSTSSHSDGHLRAGGSVVSRNQSGGAEPSWVSMITRIPSSAGDGDFSLFDSDRTLFGTSQGVLNGPKMMNLLISGSPGPSGSPPPMSPTSVQSYPSPFSQPAAILHDNDNQPPLVSQVATSTQVINCTCPSRRDMVPFWIRAEMDPRFEMELHFADTDFCPRYFC